MRAPPLPKSSFVQPVQVDHATRGLRVDGRQFNGIGWYLDGLQAGIQGGNGFGTFPNISEFIAGLQNLGGQSHTSTSGPSNKCTSSCFRLE